MTDYLVRGAYGVWTVVKRTRSPGSEPKIETVAGPFRFKVDASKTRDALTTPD